MMKAMLAASAAFFMLASQAVAQQMCAPTARTFQFLFEEFAEVPVWHGVDNRGLSVVLTMSQDGTWTLLVADDEQACIVADGPDARIAEGV